MEDEVLTTTETAKVLGISVRTAQLLIEGGRIPSWKTPGGHRRVHRSAVEALLTSPQPSALAASATVIVVTPDKRQPLFQHQIESLGYLSPQFHSNTWSAAIAAAVRTPAVLVVDLESGGGEGVSLLSALASDARFNHAEFVVVVPAEWAHSETLPARVHAVTFQGLSEILRRLTGVKPPMETHVVDEGFPVAENEKSRLQAVQRSGIVDTPPEISFDRVTWLASAGLKTPVALMTVLTAERQWFKSRQGLELAETPRAWAFCNHTVLQKGVFEVKDLKKDPNFANNPAVVDAPNFRFYAGAPVYDPDGFPLGSICVMDYRPRQMDINQKRTLLDLAAIASDELKLRDLALRA